MGKLLKNIRYEGAKPGEVQVKMIYGHIPGDLEWQVNKFIKENKKYYRIKIQGYSIAWSIGDEQYKEAVMLYLAPIRVNKKLPIT